MKLVVSLADLKRAIALPASVSPSSSAIPIGLHLLIQARKDRLHIMGTNFEMWAEDECPAEVEKEGSLTVPAKLFQSFVANGIPGSQISLVLEKNALVARCGRLSAKLPTLPAEEFSRPPSVLDATGIVFAAEALRMAFQRTIFAASQEQSRYYLCGINIARVKDNIEFCATDGVMLGRVRVPVSDPKLTFKSILLPTNAATAALKILEGDGDAKLEAGDRLARISHKSAAVTTRLVDGQFPDYDRVIPKSFTYDAVFSRDEFLAAFDRVAPFDDDRTISTVRLHFQKGSLELSAGTAKQAARDEIDCVYAGEPFKIALRCYVLKALIGGMPQGEIGFRFNDAVSPFLFAPSDDSEDVWIATPYHAKEIAEAA